LNLRGEQLPLQTEAAPTFLLAGTPSRCAMALFDFINRHANLQNTMLLGTALRIGLLIYGDYHDRHSSLKYTDVDYRVFSDASYFITHPTSNNSAQGILARAMSWSLGEYVLIIDTYVLFLRSLLALTLELPIDTLPYWLF
jgi:hypothetical protein